MERRRQKKRIFISYLPCRISLRLMNMLAQNSLFRWQSLELKKIGEDIFCQGKQGESGGESRRKKWKRGRGCRTHKEIEGWRFAEVRARKKLKVAAFPKGSRWEQKEEFLRCCRTRACAHPLLPLLLSFFLLLVNLLFFLLFFSSSSSPSLPPFPSFFRLQFPNLSHLSILSLFLPPLLPIFLPRQVFLFNFFFINNFYNYFAVRFRIKAKKRNSLRISSLFINNTHPVASHSGEVVTSLSLSVPRYPKCLKSGGAQLLIRAEAFLSYREHGLFTKLQPYHRNFSLAFYSKETTPSGKRGY